LLEQRNAALGERDAIRAVLGEGNYVDRDALRAANDAMRAELSLLRADRNTAVARYETLKSRQESLAEELNAARTRCRACLRPGFGGWWQYYIQYIDEC